MQTYLEKKSILSRVQNTILNNYNDEVDNIYSELHPDALSDNQPLGKGTGHGGHTHSVPDYDKKSRIDYSSFDTSDNSGGLYDKEGFRGVGGRNFLKNISKYGPNEHEYPYSSINTSANNNYKVELRNKKR